MSDDTPKWEIEIVAIGECVKLIPHYGIDADEIENPKDYLNKPVMRVIESVDMISGSGYYCSTGIKNYFNTNWGYVGKYMFEVIPNTQFIETMQECHLAKLIVILDKTK